MRGGFALPPHKETRPSAVRFAAVAVVGMRDGTFPSSQGDHLSVKTDEDCSLLRKLP